MNHQLNPEAIMLRNELEKQLRTLKNNRDKVPLTVLKTKYKTAYEALCKDICAKVSEYASLVALQGIRIHKDYLADGFPIVDETIQKSGILKDLSKAVFCRQDMEEFTALALQLREQILSALDPLFREHLGLFITSEYLENPDIPPEVYCAVNNCILRDGKWIPVEELYPTSQKTLQNLHNSHIGGTIHGRINH